MKRCQTHIEYYYYLCSHHDNTDNNTILIHYQYHFHSGHQVIQNAHLEYNTERLASKCFAPGALLPGNDTFRLEIVTSGVSEYKAMRNIDPSLAIDYRHTGYFQRRGNNSTVIRVISRTIREK